MSETTVRSDAQPPNDSAQAVPTQRIPTLTFIGGLLLAFCLPPVFCIVALRRWKNVSRRLLIVALIVSCVFVAVCISSGRLAKDSLLLDLIGWGVSLFELLLAFLLSIAYMRRRAIKPSRFLIGGAAFLVFLWGLYSVACLRLYVDRTAAVKLGKGVQQRLDAIRNAGYPVTVQDLPAWYPKIPDAENAAPIYLEAFKRFSGEEISQSDRPAIGDPMPPPLRQKIEKLLAANGPTLELLHKAAGYSRCRYDLDFAAKWEMKLPHLAQTRKCARLLMWDAALAAESGAPNRAIADIESLAALARSLHREPLVISQLVRLAVLRIAEWNLQHLLARTVLDEAQLARLSALLQAEYDEKAFAPALVAERCTGISTFLDMKQDTPKNDKKTLIYLRYLFNKDFGYYLDVMGGMIRAEESPLPTRLSVYKELAKVADEFPEGFPEGAMISAMVLPALYNIPKMEFLDISRLRAALAVLAVERYKLKYSKLPDKVEDIVPEFLEAAPVDARNQQPLGYGKAEKGFVFFLADKDGKPKPLSDQEGFTDDEKRAGVLFKVAR